MTPAEGARRIVPLIDLTDLSNGLDEPGVALDDDDVEVALPRQLRDEAAVAGPPGQAMPGIDAASRPNQAWYWLLEKRQCRLRSQ